MALEYTWDKFIFSAEYGKWYSGLNSNLPGFLTRTTISDRLYGMVNYRISDWLQTGVYYSLLYPSVNSHSGATNQMNDLALSFRIDLNKHWILKIEDHLLYGTAGLSTALNNNQPLSTLSPLWNAFIVKTTVYF